jgi:hypothetical protein
LKHSLRNFFGSLKLFGTASRSLGRRHLGVEVLEDRMVPAPLPGSPLVHIPIQHPGRSYLQITGVPAQTTAGTSFAITVTDYDSNTGAIGHYSGSVALTENSGDYYGTAWSLGSVTLTSGRATATVTPDVAGNVTIIADPGPVATSNTYWGESSALVVNPGAAASLAVSAPSTALQGVPFGVGIRAVDAWGNTATSFSQTATLSALDGALAMPQPVTPGTVNLSNGVATSNLTLNQAATVTLTATAGALTGKSRSFTVQSPITALSTNVGYAPGYSVQYLQTGSEVDVTGQDFQAGARVIFGDPGTSDPHTLWQLANQPGVGSPAAVNSSGTWLSVNVPRYAVNGPIVVVNPDGTGLKSSQSLTINNYRNTNAFNFHNFDYNITWGEVKNEFGGSQVDICVPNPFGSGDTGVPSPIALGVWGITAAALNGKGACFGMALTSVLMSEYNSALISAANGLPSGSAATVFNLQQNDALTGLVEQNHLAQISQQIIGNYLGWEVSSHSASSVYNQISSLLSAGHHPIISLEAGANHAVVAYNLEPGPNGNGDYYIDVYDSNRPFNGPASYGLDPKENVDLTTHVQIEQASRILVNAAGSWSYVMADGSLHTGGFGSLQVVPVSLVSGGVTFPGNFTEILTGGALTVIFGSEAVPSDAPKGKNGAQPSMVLPAFQTSSEGAFSMPPQVPSAWQVSHGKTDGPTRAAHGDQTSAAFFDVFGESVLESRAA